MKKSFKKKRKGSTSPLVSLYQKSLKNNPLAVWAQTPDPAQFQRVEFENEPSPYDPIWDKYKILLT